MPSSAQRPRWYASGVSSWWQVKQMLLGSTVLEAVAPMRMAITSGGTSKT